MELPYGKDSEFLIIAFDLLCNSCRIPSFVVSHNEIQINGGRKLLENILGPSSTWPGPSGPSHRSRGHGCWVSVDSPARLSGGHRRSSGIFRTHLAMEAEKRSLFRFWPVPGGILSSSHLNIFGRRLDHDMDPYEATYSNVTEFTVTAVIE